MKNKKNALTNRERDLYEDFTAGSVFNAQMVGDDFGPLLTEIQRKTGINVFNVTVEKGADLPSVLDTVLLGLSSYRTGAPVLVNLRMVNNLNTKHLDELNEVLSSRVVLDTPLSRNIFLLATGQFGVGSRMCFNNQTYNNVVNS